MAWSGFGVLAALLGTATGHLVAALGQPDTSPVLAIGSAVIDATPTPVKEWAIRSFGTADKPILIGSVLAGAVLLAAISGFLARTNIRYGLGLQTLLVASAAAAVLTRPTSSLADLLPTAATLLVGAAALVLLGRLDTPHPARTRAHRPPHPRNTPPGAAETPTSDPTSPPVAQAGAGRGASRRSVLIAAAIMGAAATALAGTGNLITRLRARPEDITLPPAADPAGAFPQGLETQIDNITPLRTPTGDFYRVDTRLDTPVIDLEDWSLTIDGDVDQEVTLTFEDLLGMGLIERDITLTCVSNSVGGEFVGSARWLGVRLVDVLALAGIDSTRADQILATDFDGMTISTPLELAIDGRDAMIAIGMNGQALPREHGFPARIVIPGLYGFISATKWVTRLTLTTYAERSAYWTDRDWATKAPIKISTRIDTPSAFQQLRAGANIIGGVAWAQQRGGVDQVQVQIDGGPWLDAEMGPEVSSDYWRQWFYRWDAPPGPHTVAARAISGDGETQTAVRALPFPEGASGVQALRVTVT